MKLVPIFILYLNELFPNDVCLILLGWQNPIIENMSLSSSHFNIELFPVK